MFKRLLGSTARLLIVLLCLALLAVMLARLATGLYAVTRSYKPAEAPARQAAIVFGAGLWRDGSPSPVLRNRVNRAVQLYFEGKVEKILMSGDNRTIYYNEPGAMHAYALRLGVPETDIVLDYAGWRTYDTCYRAKEIFGLEDVILVTQEYHLSRALYTCNALGLSSIGVSADLPGNRPGTLLYWNLREVAATSVAMWELYVAQPVPVLGNPEPIFPTEAQ